MKLLTEQLRNGQITVEDAIEIALSLTQDQDIVQFLKISGDRIGGELEKKEDAIRDKIAKEEDEWEEKIVSAKEIGYSDGWNDCLDSVESNLPAHK